MSKMVKYNFSALGEDFTVAVRENDFGLVYEKGDAMASANRTMFTRQGQAWMNSQGTWTEQGSATFIWSEVHHGIC